SIQWPHEKRRRISFSSRFQSATEPAASRPSGELGRLAQGWRATHRQCDERGPMESEWPPPGSVPATKPVASVLAMSVLRTEEGSRREKASEAVVCMGRGPWSHLAPETLGERARNVQRGYSIEAHARGPRCRDDMSKLKAARTPTPGPTGAHCHQEWTGGQAGGPEHHDKPDDRRL